jgi:hypothetical protein
MFLFGAGAPIYAGTIDEFQVGQTLGGTGSNLYTNVQDGSAVSDTVNWSFTCSTCSGYGISANGAATVNGGSLGASASVTVTGTPGGTLVATAASDADFTDMLTTTGGLTGTSAVLELTYGLDGVISNTGTDQILSYAYLNLNGPAGTMVQYDGGALASGGYVEIDGNGTYTDTVTFYIPITYGTALPTDVSLWAEAIPYGESTSDTATVNYYNTAALTSALVFGGTPSDPGTENNAAVIGAASGLNYGPNGISAAPEPGTWLLVASAMGVLALAKRRRAFRPTL